MTRLTYRQGIVNHGKSPGQAFFLQRNGEYVDLLVSPATTSVVFADGAKDYLFTEATSRIKAWGSFTVAEDRWLYWELSRVTGVRTYGSTTIAPLYGTTVPTSPLTGQMWFDTSPATMKMYEYNGTTWTQVLRVLAAKYDSAFQILSPVDNVSVETNFTGSQVAVFGTRYVGSLAFDQSGKPIINQNGQFFTTEDLFTTGVPTGASLKVNDILLRGQATQTIAKHQVVVFDQYERISLATTFDNLTKVYGIVEEDIPTNDVGNVIMEGVIFDEEWDFTDVINHPTMNGNINAPIYITSTGELTTDITLSIPTQLPVGVIIGQQSILFRPGIFNNAAAVLDHGTLSGLGDDDHVHYVNEARGDVRYYTQTAAGIVFAPMSHTHGKADVTDFAHTHVETDVTDLDKYTQAEADVLFADRLSLSGGTMLGSFVLNGDPTAALGAVTKQYADTIGSSLNRKASVAVLPTADVGGTYNPTGGTGGTGEITGVDITALDGAIDVAYDFNTITRILLSNQTDDTQNGIFVVSTLGSPLASSTLERADDHDGTPSSEVAPGDFVFVNGGTANSGSGWSMLPGTTTGPNDTIILNTDDIIFTQSTASIAYTAGANIAIDGSNVISVQATAGGGTVDALTWNTETITVTSPVVDHVLKYNVGSTTWENGYPAIIRNVANTSNVMVDTGTDAVSITSANGFVLTSTGNANLSSTLAINLSSTGNTNIVAGTSSILLNNTNDITLTSASVVVNPISGNGNIKLNSGADVVTVSASAVMTGPVAFNLPATTGTVNQILSTDGIGNSVWVDHTIPVVNQVYDISAEGKGALSDSNVILRFKSVREFIIESSGHDGYAHTAPTTANAVFDVVRQLTSADGGSIIGTLTFLDGVKDPTITGFTTPTTISVDNILSIVCTSASNVEDVAITLKAHVVPV